jgi:DNA-binding beta-propeller fold protein YncE
MTSARRWLWVACAIAGAAVVALAVSLVPVAEPTAGAPDAPPAEPFRLGAPVTVSVGESPQAVAPTPDGRRVLVLDQTGLVVLDAGPSTVLGTISLRSGYGGLVLAPGGERAYVRSTEGIEPVDLTTGLIGDVLGGDADAIPDSIDAISPDGARLSGTIYETEPALGLVDLASGTARRIPLPLGASPDELVVTPDGSRAYVAVRSLTVGSIADPLQVVDVATSGATPVPDTEGTLSVALSADGRSVHAIGYSQAVVLDAATGAVTRSVPMSLLSGQFVVSRSGRYLYIVDVTGNGVEVFDMDSGGVVANVAIGAQPRDLALAPDGSRLYVVSDAGLTVVPVAGGM